LICPLVIIENVYLKDPNRENMRELPLPRCIEIWGLYPFGKDLLTVEAEEKYNMSNNTVYVSNIAQSMNLPIIAPKYLKWLRNRQEICREVSSMMQIGQHTNIISLYEVLELIQVGGIFFLYLLISPRLIFVKRI
jgi:hypothetical protein